MTPRISKLTFTLLLAGTGHAAFGFSAVFTNEAEHAKITVADYPGQRDLRVVAWQDVPGVTPASGAMVYAQDRSTSETRYFAIGGGGLFALVERGHGRRHGTSFGAFDVVADDPKHPLGVVVDPHQTVDVPALLAQYGAFENVAAPGETSAVIDAAVGARAAQTNRACGSQIAAKLQWKTFATPASVRLAKQTVSILEAIAGACADKDYATAVRGVRELRVDYQADGGALRLERTGATLAVQLSDTSFNPRETARTWLTDHL